MIFLTWSGNENKERLNGYVQSTVSPLEKLYEGNEKL